MNINEFKAWLEGFSEAIGTAPNTKQWEKIKAKIAAIKENKEIITVDRPYPVYPYPIVYWLKKNRYDWEIQTGDTNIAPARFFMSSNEAYREMGKLEANN